MKRKAVRRIVLFFTFLIALFGCEQAEYLDSPEQIIEAGNYSGRFIFTEHGIVSQGNVYFTFTSDSYSCTPEIEFLPPDGGGKYEILNEKIILTDLSAHRANFDWSLILNSEFLFIRKDEKIFLIQKGKKRERQRYIELTKLLTDSLSYESMMDLEQSEVL